MAELNPLTTPPSQPTAPADADLREEHKRWAAWFVATELEAGTGDDDVSWRAWKARARHPSPADDDLSKAYLRLRALIPDAFRTPFAPTPEQVWAHTEACLRAAIAAPAAPVSPIDMVLHCPACGMQHIDAPEYNLKAKSPCTWDNPPHRSHKCRSCGHIWRPADVPTNGVAAVKTTGKADSPIAAPRAQAVPPAEPEHVPSSPEDSAAIDAALNLKVISIRLDVDLIERYKAAATVHGTPYQALMRMALADADLGAAPPEAQQALRLFVGAAYPVSKDIDPRGYRWSEAYLDQALAAAQPSLKEQP